MSAQHVVPGKRYECREYVQWNSRCLVGFGSFKVPIASTDDYCSDHSDHSCSFRNAIGGTLGGALGCSFLNAIGGSKRRPDLRPARPRSLHKTAPTSL